MKDIIKKADEIFSILIRLRAANDNGYVRCISCGSIQRWTEAHNGHYIPRQHMATRFDFLNCNVQCRHCNVDLSGNLEKYKEALILKHGSEIVEDLVLKKTWTCKYLDGELKEMIAAWKEEIKHLKKTKGL